MNRPTKLLILILLSMSVLIIYNETNNRNYNILNIGDSISLGTNSYGIKDYSYIDYYKDYLENNKYKVIVNNNYSNKELSIKELLQEIKTSPSIKKDLIEAHILILEIGYNDLLYKVSIEENITKNKLNVIIREIEDNYNNLIKEINKYYKKQIIVIGFHKSNIDNYYLNLGIKKLNKVLQSNKKVSYIDTYLLLNNNKVYMNNPNSYYPNKEAYQLIANEIIEKTLEK